MSPEKARQGLEIPPSSWEKAEFAPDNFFVSIALPDNVKLYGIIKAKPAITWGPLVIPMRAGSQVVTGKEDSIFNFAAIRNMHYFLSDTEVQLENINIKAAGSKKHNGFKLTINSDTNGVGLDFFREYIQDRKVRLAVMHATPMNMAIDFAKDIETAFKGWRVAPVDPTKL
jgi:hypothetical protein